MSLLTEQLSSAAQTQLAKQITVFQAWSQLAFGGLEKLIALNFNTAKQSLENANSVTRELLAVKQPQELLDVSRTHSQPQIEKFLSYGRELASITSSTRAEIWQIVSKQAPSVTETAVTETKTAPASTTKPEVKKPVAAKPIAETKQLTLLAETEAKPAKAPLKQKPSVAVTEKATVKPVVKPVTKTQIAKVEAKPATIKAEIKKPQTNSPVSTVEVKPVAPETIPTTVPTPAASSATAATIPKASEKKTVSTKQTAAKAVTKASPVANESIETTEKKSAVKFPFPATSNLKKTSGFPVNSGKPAYKAKSSAATGAKKPVRQ
ncbi:phasin family protein [Undibacterium umbellatum]|uniref:TIGR01841 family phasin n=1 Tax=Undibacterium umbellatum TaxID=2762300 RepID=A0ABR6ZDI7_9BURK|nr:phasin family protein [Undibacterium umbellatum]MBC3909814.1 TIGR01841 family phasin [Undibacterium umbellatum]